MPDVCKAQQLSSTFGNTQLLLDRYGGKRDVYQNTKNKKKTIVPRHSQLNKILCDMICKQLEIPKMS